MRVRIWKVFKPKGASPKEWQQLVIPSAPAVREEDISGFPKGVVRVTAVEGQLEGPCRSSVCCVLAYVWNVWALVVAGPDVLWFMGTPNSTRGNGHSG